MPILPSIRFISIVYQSAGYFVLVFFVVRDLSFSFSFSFPFHFFLAFCSHMDAISWIRNLIDAKLLKREIIEQIPGRHSTNCAPLLTHYFTIIFTKKNNKIIISDKLRSQHGIGCKINWFFGRNAIETRLRQFDNSNTNHKSKKWKEKSGRVRLPRASFRNDDQVKAIR